jgi:hypothetical protein
MFYMMMPNTQIEIDIPIYQYLPVKGGVDAQNTRAVTPDVLITPNVNDIIKSQDGVLHRAIAYIQSTN